MTTYHEKVLKAVKEINKRIRILREALFKAVEEGVQSASISSGGASQSYSRMSCADIREEIARLERAKQQLLSGSRTGIAPNFTYPR